MADKILTVQIDTDALDDIVRAVLDGEPVDAIGDDIDAALTWGGRGAWLAELVDGPLADGLAQLVVLAIERTRDALDAT